MQESHFSVPDTFLLRLIEGRKSESQLTGPFGKPCVERDFCAERARSVREGLSFSQIIQDYYPDLETEDIRACIQYAIDVVAVEDSRLATTQ